MKLLTYWIKNEPDVLKESIFTNRLQIWPSLCKLLNNVQQYLKNFDCSKCKLLFLFFVFIINFVKIDASTPLLEDKLLQGFQPLLKNFKDLDFKEDIDDTKIEKLLRMKRLIDFGMFISDLDVNNSKLITK